MLRTIAGLSVLSALLIVFVTVGGPVAEAAPHISGFERTGAFKQLATDVAEDLSHESRYNLTGYERPLDVRDVIVEHGAEPATSQRAGFTGFTNDLPL